MSYCHVENPSPHLAQPGLMAMWLSHGAVPNFL